MELSVVENYPTPCGIIFSLFRGSQLNFEQTLRKASLLLIWGSAAGRSLFYFKCIGGGKTGGNAGMGSNLGYWRCV